MSDALARLDAARKMLAEARTLEDFKKIRDVAEAARAYVKAARLGRDAQNYAAEISLMASRKAGSFLRTLKRAKPKAKGGRVRNSDYWTTLKETDTPYRTAQMWQKLADVPEDTVSRYVAAERKADKGEISAAGLLRANRPKKAKGKSQFDRQITVPFTRSEFLCIKVWAKTCYAPTEDLTGEQQFVRATIQEVLQQSGMGGSPIDMVSIRERIAEWLERKERLDFGDEIEAEVSSAK